MNNFRGDLTLIQNKTNVTSPLIVCQKLPTKSTENKSPKQAKDP